MTTIENPMIVLRPGQPAEVLPLTTDQDETYAAIQEHIPGYLEAVYMPDAVMFIDENGKDPRKYYEPNLLAGRAFAYARGYDLGPESTLQDVARVLGDWIVGPAVICGMEPGNPETIGLKQETVEKILATIGTVPES